MTDSSSFSVVSSDGLGLSHGDSSDVDRPDGFQDLGDQARRIGRERFEQATDLEVLDLIDLDHPIGVTALTVTRTL
jgi:hypothetical protein